MQDTSSATAGPVWANHAVFEEKHEQRLLENRSWAGRPHERRGTR